MDQLIVLRLLIRPAVIDISVKTARVVVRTDGNLPRAPRPRGAWASHLLPVSGSIRHAIASHPTRLVSVSDKLGLADFARGLVAAGVEIYSTGGTRKYLEAEGIAVRDVAEYTGFPEMMDGRLKTLHPKVHGGILCRHDNPEDMKALAEHGILTFELVVVNLYPFEATIARPA